MTAAAAITNCLGRRGPLPSADADTSPYVGDKGSASVPQRHPLRSVLIGRASARIPSGFARRETRCFILLEMGSMWYNALRCRSVKGGRREAHTGTLEGLR